MAHYLIVNEDDTPLGLIVEAKNIQRAIEDANLADGAKVEVYRIANGPRKVAVKAETIRRIEIT